MILEFFKLKLGSLRNVSKLTTMLLQLHWLKVKILEIHRKGLDPQEQKCAILFGELKEILEFFNYLDFRKLFQPCVLFTKHVYITNSQRQTAEFWLFIENIPINKCRQFHSVAVPIEFYGTCHSFTFTELCPEFPLLYIKFGQF